MRSTRRLRECENRDGGCEDRGSECCDRSDVSQCDDAKLNESTRSEVSAVSRDPKVRAFARERGFTPASGFSPPLRQSITPLERVHTQCPSVRDHTSRRAVAAADGTEDAVPDK